MTSPYLAALLAGEHEADLRRQAGGFRLAALARCCRPGTWGRALRRAVTAGNRVRGALHDRSGAPSGCCAAA